MIVRRNAEMPLNVVDIEHVEIMLARHVQCFVFGRLYANLSVDREEYGML